jgi:hypothetical protein
LHILLPLDPTHLLEQHWPLLVHEALLGRQQEASSSQSPCGSLQSAPPSQSSSLLSLQSNSAATGEPQSEGQLQDVSLPEQVPF